MTSSWLIEELPPLVSSPKANSRGSGRGTTGMLQTARAATRRQGAPRREVACFVERKIPVLEYTLRPNGRDPPCLNWPEGEEPQGRVRHRLVEILKR